MVLAMQFAAPGAPSVLAPTTVTLAQPGPGQVRLRHTAIGLNYIDTYHRSGYYPVPLPVIPGLEAAGVIEAVGHDVSAYCTGDRVAYGRGPLGAYAQARLIAATELVKLPTEVSDEVAASAMLKGLTAWALLHEVFPVAPGDTILVHAAAGGVGLLLVQWAKALGCRVIGTVGSEEKAELATRHGCDAVIFYRHEDVAARIKTLTDGRGVDVVYDAVGRDTFVASLDSLRPKGMLVSFGQASGPVPAFEMRELASRGSLFLTRPSVTDYVKDNATYHRAATALLAQIANGTLAVRVDQRFALTDAALAHEALEARKTTGSTVLLP